MAQVLVHARRAWRDSRSTRVPTHTHTHHPDPAPPLSLRPLARIDGLTRACVRGGRSLGVDTRGGGLERRGALTSTVGRAARESTDDSQAPGVVIRVRRRGVVDDGAQFWFSFLIRGADAIALEAAWAWAWAGETH